MPAEPEKVPAEPVEADESSEIAAHAVSLVPIKGAPAIVPGIQAFRRGDLILYTVRGEPAEVQELMARLSEDNVGEVVALISHQAEDADEDAAGDVGEDPAGDDGVDV
jgi:hypothetical protein